MKNKYRLSVFLGFLLLSTGGYAQKLNDFLDAYLGQNREGYLHPLADLVNAGSNTGLQPSARIDGQFYVRFNLTALGVMPSTAQKTFSATTEASFSPEQTATVPTVVGENTLVSVEGENGTKYTFPGGYGLKRLFWAVPQLSIGGIYGTEVSLRLLPVDFGEDFGKLSILGIGIRHDVGRYVLKKSPFALNVGYAYHKTDIGRAIAAQSHYAYVQAGLSGRRGGIFAWAGYQTGTFAVSYEYIENNHPPQAVTADLTVKKPFLGGIGAHLQLGFFSLGAGVGGPSPLTGYGTMGFRFGKSPNQ